eukprot:9414063-Ditylum_brightwellii.AAC.1
MFVMHFPLFHTSKKLPKPIHLVELSIICALLCCVVSAETGECETAYCSRCNNPQFLDQNCCTFGSASECGYCLPDKDGAETPSGCDNNHEHPMWESCVND